MEKNRRNYTPIPETGLIRTEAAGSEAGEMTENASREQRRRRRFEKERTSREQEQRRERGRGGRLVRARRQWSGSVAWDIRGTVIQQMKFRGLRTKFKIEGSK